jgi:hypothetical protein
MGLLLKASKPPNAHLVLDTQEATFFEARVRSGGEPAQENPLQQKNVCQMGDMGTADISVSYLQHPTTAEVLSTRHPGTTQVRKPLFGPPLSLAI